MAKQASVTKSVDAPPSSILDLDELPEPKFEVRFEGQLRSYDPWELAEKLAGFKDADASSGDFKSISIVREALKIETLTVNQCFAVVSALFEFIRGLPTIKKLQDLTQSLSDSTQV